MSESTLVEGTACPVCTLGGVLTLETTSEADLVDGRTVVVHGVPVYVCTRCGAEFFDEATTRELEVFYRHAAHDRARVFVVDYESVETRAAAS
ncbi:MAG: YgiT-type zinc finger protein [Egibacteraceae bacterium]